MILGHLFHFLHEIQILNQAIFALNPGAFSLVFLKNIFGILDSSKFRIKIFTTRSRPLRAGGGKKVLTSAF